MHWLVGLTKAFGNLNFAYWYELRGLIVLSECLGISQTDATGIFTHRQ